MTPAARRLTAALSVLLLVLLPQSAAAGIRDVPPLAVVDAVVGAVPGAVPARVPSDVAGDVAGDVPGTGPESAAGYVAPVPGVVPPAGVVHGFDPPSHKWGAGHRGVDLISSAGATVVSPGAGIVTFAGPVAGRGVVVVTHPGGLRSSLEPVAPGVAVGDEVVAGSPVGVVEGAGFVGGAGASHCAPDACVHWGVRRGEQYLDPLTLLARPVIVLLPLG